LLNVNIIRSQSVGSCGYGTGPQNAFLVSSSGYAASTWAMTDALNAG
jgi:hypothetical protein